MKVLERSGELWEGKFEEQIVKEAFWHTSAHVLAHAVKRLYPDTKCAIGPAIENGFYYDFDFSFPFTEEHLASVEAERSQEIRSGVGIVYFYGGRTGISVFSAERNDSEKSIAGLLAGYTPKRRVYGNFHTDDAEPPTVGDIGTLGSLSGKYVYNYH